MDIYFCIVLLMPVLVIISIFAFLLKKNLKDKTLNHRRINPAQRKLVFTDKLAQETQVFQDNGDGTLTDTETGLMWVKDINIIQRKMNFMEAMEYCTHLDYAGYKDWRLPAREELESLVPFMGIQVIKEYLPQPPLHSRNQMRSSNRIRSPRDIDPTGLSNYTISAWPVRNGQHIPSFSPPKESYFIEMQFTDNEDGTVTDPKTGLMWTKDANLAEERMNWYEAIKFCNDLDHAGYRDWRLPTIEELESLVDEGKPHPALSDGHPFHGVQHSFYWASSKQRFTDTRWVVLMRYGHHAHTYNLNYTCCVWPVRTESVLKRNARF